LLAAENNLQVMTFNVGSSEGEAKADAEAGEFSRELASIADKHYGNGLAWLPAVEATRDFIAQQRPHIIGFQEIFDPSRCAKIRAELHQDFVCEYWRSGDRSVVEYITGKNYQVACHKGTSEKCLAVRKDFARIRGCHQDYCENFLEGRIISGCGSKSRLGKAVLDTYGGKVLNVIHIHGTSGFSGEDRKCRKRQFRSIFEEELGKAPLIGRAANIVLGDFNTDPRRLRWFDSSARKLKSYVKGTPFQFINDKADQRDPTYAGIVSIDHVISDDFVGKCKVAGISEELPAVLKTSYFDHKPLLCDLWPDPYAQ